MRKICCVFGRRFVLLWLSYFIGSKPDPLQTLNCWSHVFLLESQISLGLKKFPPLSLVFEKRCQRQSPYAAGIVEPLGSPKCSFCLERSCFVTSSTPEGTSVSWQEKDTDQLQTLVECHVLFFHESQIIRV